MNILGIGPQIFIIAFLALLLFGPKKMIQYAYQAGRYAAQLRAMWEQTAKAVQKEFEEAGLNLPPEVLTGRFDIGAEAMKVINHSPAPPVVPTVPTVAAVSASLPEVPTVAAPSAAANSLPSTDHPAEPSLNVPPDDPQPGKYDAWLPN